MQVFPPGIKYRGRKSLSFSRHEVATDWGKLGETVYILLFETVNQISSLRLPPYSSPQELTLTDYYHLSLAVIVCN